jgi:hypothetical protein
VEAIERGKSVERNTGISNALYVLNKIELNQEYFPRGVIISKIWEQLVYLMMTS